MSNELLSNYIFTTRSYFESNAKLQLCRSLVRGAMVPRRNDLLVNQSKIDGTSPKKELLSQSQKKEDI